MDSNLIISPSFYTYVYSSLSNHVNAGLLYPL